MKNVIGGLQASQRALGSLKVIRDACNRGALFSLFSVARDSKKGEYLRR